MVSQLVCDTLGILTHTSLYSKSLKRISILGLNEDIITFLDNRERFYTSLEEKISCIIYVDVNFVLSPLPILCLLMIAPGAFESHCLPMDRSAYDI